MKKEQWSQILHKEDQGVMTPVLSERGELGFVCVKCEALYNLSIMGSLPSRMTLTDDLMLYSVNPKD